MNYKGLTAVVDADSICYGAGYSEVPQEAAAKFNEYINRIKQVLEPKEVLGFCEAPTGKNIFRNHVAVTIPYKSNRIGKDKPTFLNEMKEYARTKHGFKWCYYVESEDAVSILSYTMGLNNVVKCCIDKDMLTGAGLFFNYFGKGWKLPYYTPIDEYVISVSPEQAEANLCTQVLCGDSDDAIGGIVGCGAVKAKAIIESDSPLELRLKVAEAYKTAHLNFNKVTTPLTYEYLLEQSRLIYILRRRGEVFTIVTREQWEAIECD